MRRPKNPSDQCISLPNNWSCRPHQLGLWNYIVNEGGKRAFVLWHRRCGKDSCAINIMATMMHKGKPGLYYYMAPEANHARKIIWNNIGSNGQKVIDQAIPDSLRKRTNDQEMLIETKYGSIFLVVGSDNYDSIVGTNPRGLIFSEWALADPKAWTYLSPILAENDGWAIFITTPRGLNHCFKQWSRVTLSDNWFTERLTIEDTGIIDAEFVERERREEGKSESEIQSEYYCSFTADLDFQLFDMEALVACEGRDAPIDDPQTPTVMGVDVARYGPDPSVICVRTGADMKTVPLQGREKLDTFQLTEWVMQSVQKYSPDAVFVDNTGGYGGGLIDHLRWHGVPVMAVNFTAAAQDPRTYANTRAEIYDRFNKWTREPDSALQPGLLEECQLITKDFDTKGRIQLQDKHSIRKKLGASTDKADACALTFARSVPRRSLGHYEPPEEYALM